MIAEVLRWGGIVVVACALACGPNVAEPSADGSDDSGAASTEVGTSTTATSVSTTATSTTTTVGTTAADTGPPGESGCLDGCGMCPWEPCAPDEYCDRDTLMCMPLPDALPACEDARWVVEPAVIPIAAPAIDLTFVDVDGVGGRELVLVDDNGAIEVRTPTLDPWGTSTLPEPVTRIFAADIDGDAFGDLIARAANDVAVLALSGDGTGTFATSTQHMPGGTIGPMAVGDWNDDGLEDVAVATLDGGVATVVSALRDPVDGFVVVSQIPLDAAATALAAIPADEGIGWVGSSRVDLQACKLEYSIVSPK